MISCAGGGGYVEVGEKRYEIERGECSEAVVEAIDV